jgi:hyperosmotically inducible protein
MKTLTSATVQDLALICVASLLLAACDNPQDKPQTAASTTMSSAPAGTSIGTDIDDSVVTTRVKSALLADSEVKSFDIKVETRKGLVQLSGFVDTQARIDNAIALVSKVEGVKSIENGMTVKDGVATVGNTVDDSIVTAKIKSALLADPAVRSLDIAVVTRKGQVQLSGYVTNQTQINRALEIVKVVDGVSSINNEISIKQ